MSEIEFYVYGLPILTFVAGFFLGAVLCGIRMPKKAFSTLNLPLARKSDDK